MSQPNELKIIDNIKKLMANDFNVVNDKYIYKFKYYTYYLNNNNTHSKKNKELYNLFNELKNYPQNNNYTLDTKTKYESDHICTKYILSIKI